MIGDRYGKKGKEKRGKGMRERNGGDALWVWRGEERGKGGGRREVNGEEWLGNVRLWKVEREVRRNKSRVRKPVHDLFSYFFPFKATIFQ